MILKNALVLDETFRFQKTDLRFGETIEEMGKVRTEGQEVMELSGYRVIPGLIDIHTHAALNECASSGHVNYEKWRNFMLKNGVTTFFPTTVTGSREDICKWLENLARIPQVEGINLEGPYLSKERKGAHIEEAIRPVDLQELMEFQKAANGKIKLTTIAPEVGENLNHIQQIAASGIAVSLGHSSAEYDCGKCAIAQGANHVTHLFNAMNSLHHRQPGLIGAVMEDETVFCEIVCDGIHVHNAVLKMAYQALGSDRMILISDSMEATGLSDGRYVAGGLDVTVKDGIARTEYGAIAGSTYTLSMMIRNLISIGIPMEEAVKMAALTPARSVKMDNQKGSIAIGKDADLVVVDDNFQIVHTFVKGKLV